MADDGLSCNTREAFLDMLREEFGETILFEGAGYSGEIFTLSAAYNKENGYTAWSLSVTNDDVPENVQTCFFLEGDSWSFSGPFDSDILDKDPALVKQAYEATESIPLDDLPELIESYGLEAYFVAYNSDVEQFIVLSVDPDGENWSLFQSFGTEGYHPYSQPLLTEKVGGESYGVVESDSVDVGEGPPVLQMDL